MNEDFVWQFNQRTLVLGMHNGLFAIKSMVCGETGEFCVPGPGLWQVELINAQQEIKVLEPCFYPESEQLESTLVMRWSFPDYADITVEINHLTGGDTEWFITIDPADKCWSVREVHFPRFDWQLEGGEDCKLIVPEDTGAVYPDPLNSLKTGGSGMEIPRVQIRSYPHGGQSMQFFALTHGDDMIYFAAHDYQALVKGFGLKCDRENRVLNVRAHWHCTYLPGEKVRSFAWHFSMCKGDWFDAALRYRKFALKAPWLKKGALEDGKKTPEWMLKTPMVLLRLQRGAGWSVDDFISDAEYFKVPLLVHYYLWHKSAFDANYPFFFPTVPGFRDDVEKLKANGVRVMPYCNFFSADTNMDDWSYLKQSALQINEKGDIHSAVWSQQIALAEMCTASAQWKRLASLIALRVVDLGVDGVYFDEMGMSPPYACCSTEHGHRPGDPEVFCQSWNKLLADIRNDGNEINPELVFGSEGCSEPFIANVDSFTAGSANSPYMKPLWQAVYHDFSMGFGRYTFAAELGNPKFAGAIETKHAEQFTMGLQFGWSRVPWNQVRRKLPEAAAYVRMLAQIRCEHYLHLACGKMLRPLELDVPEIELLWARAWNDDNGTLIKRPAVINSVWQCNDASIAVVLTNLSNEEQEVKTKFPSVQMYDAPVTETWGAANYRYPMPQACPCLVIIYQPESRTEIIPDGDSTNGYQLKLPARAVAVMLISSEKPYGVHEF